MILIVWEFEVPADARARFEAAYGPDGVWARLFRGASGFVRSELLADPARHGRYVTLDFWRSAEDYDRFRGAVRAEYDAIDVQCETLTSSERLVGTFRTLP
jgi:heme-degrading monooxygenase HmoA